MDHFTAFYWLSAVKLENKANDNYSQARDRGGVISPIPCAAFSSLEFFSAFHSLANPKSEVEDGFPGNRISLAWVEEEPRRAASGERDEEHMDLSLPQDTNVVMQGPGK